MRLLHTSDWHLGRSLHRADLRDAQAAFLDGLVDVVRSERVDAVLVAGDVYDRAVPPVEAVTLCESALLRLREAGARVILISGNHDSATRLGFSARLLDAAGVHLRTSVAGSAVPVVLADDHGEVAVYAIPYLEPAAVRADLPPDPADPSLDAPRGHAGVLGRCLSAARADLARRGSRSVVLAHAWVTGGQPTDSERDITVGGVGSVPAALFDGFSYVALGHLHRPQELGPALRYSGSPLAYSFSEAGQAKGSWLVELGATGVTFVEQVPAPVPRRLTVLRATLQEALTAPGYEDLRDDWLSVTLTDAARPEDAMARLRTRFPHVLVLEWAPQDRRLDDRTYRARIHGLDDLQVAARFVEHVRGTPALPAEVALLGQAFEAGRLTEHGLAVR
ncbi:MAG: exonuclease SbcCD subunit D [Actinomycetota bacterium]|nr:exonuclease SbcCD subunit D [Actinomycetota bacterium]